MREPEPPTILSCGHVSVKDDRCATTDCPNYVGIDESWNYRLPEEYLGGSSVYGRHRRNHAVGSLRDW